MRGRWLPSLVSERYNSPRLAQVALSEVIRPRCLSSPTALLPR